MSHLVPARRAPAPLAPRAFAWAAVLALLAPALPASAQGTFTMPLGSRQWIKMSGNWVADGICCDDAIGGVGSIPDPSPNYVHTTNSPGVVRANADSRANRVRSSYFDFLTDSVFLNNSMMDTYTISGPPGTEGTPVDARVVLHTTGTLFVGFTNTIAGHVGTSNVRSVVGAWNPDTNALEQFRVGSFGPGFEVRERLPFANYGMNTPTLAVDSTIDQILSRTVGAPFDVGFMIETNGNGCGNLSGAASASDGEYLVATIDWILPARNSIASVLGWTSPNAPPTCPADFNTDGNVDPDDLGDFITCFFTIPPCAAGDFNHDGNFDPDDLGDFITTFFGPPC